MPNLTVEVGRDRPPIVHLFFAPTEARADALRGAGEPVPEPIHVAAMLDTGAAATCITEALARRLGLEPGGEMTVHGLGAGPGVGASYRVRVYFSGASAPELVSSLAVIGVEDLDTFGVDALVGRDLLSRCLLLYNGPHGVCTFAF